jgi:Cu(I)/Ag(I) efflux system periplasmic protein CusF
MIKRFSAALLAAALAAPAFAQAPLADAEVRKVDKGTGKITLKHGEIRNLDMPPMTMVFGVADKALLDKVQKGDRVKFAADKNAAGDIVVTAIEPAPGK